MALLIFSVVLDVTFQLAHTSYIMEQVLQAGYNYGYGFTPLLQQLFYTVTNTGTVSQKPTDEKGESI